MTNPPNTETDQPLDLDAIEAATRHALESMVPGHLVSAALHAIALTAEVRKLREALEPFGEQYSRERWLLKHMETTPAPSKEKTAYRPSTSSVDFSLLADAFQALKAPQS